MFEDDVAFGLLHWWGWVLGEAIPDARYLDVGDVLGVASSLAVFNCSGSFGLAQGWYS